MNKAVLIGRLTRDPEVRYSGQGQDATCIAKFTLAVDRRRSSNKEKEADFISCVAFGKQAEAIEKYVVQGTKISLWGHIQTGSYTNKDNQKVYTTDVIVDEWEFSESKSSQTQEKNDPAPAPEERHIGEGFLNIPNGVDDEGLPFN